MPNRSEYERPCHTEADAQIAKGANAIARISKYVRACACTILCSVFASCAGTPQKEIKTAENIDIARYAGRWYEIARLPNSFQNDNEGALAEYTALANGRLKIENSALDANGRIIRVAKATAYVPDISDSSKLRVAFFWPFYADYYILEIGKNYEWALVGGSSSKYLWILSRTPALDKEVLAHILDSAKARGYDISKLKFNAAAK